MLFVEMSCDCESRSYNLVEEFDSVAELEVALVGKTRAFLSVAGDLVLGEGLKLNLFGKAIFPFTETALEMVELPCDTFGIVSEFSTEEMES